MQIKDSRGKPVLYGYRAGLCKECDGQWGSICNATGKVTCRNGHEWTHPDWVIEETCCGKKDATIKGLAERCHAQSELLSRRAEKPLSDAEQRKRQPVFSGVLNYFPDAIRALAHCSWVGNEQHNPGEPLHWAREKSTDHADCIVRHLMQQGTVDSDGVRHMTKVAWRALALLQLELEAAGGK